MLATVDLPAADNMVSRFFRLPVRPPPIPEEAAISYLIRLSQANGFPTQRQFWQALRTRDSDMSLDELMNMVGDPVNDLPFLLGPVPHYWKASGNLMAGLRINDYNHCLMRWCPLCLGESLHLHGDWGLKLQCVCTKHRVMLVDRCPACGATQRFERNTLEKCPCGEKLAGCEAVPAPAGICRLNEWLAYGTGANAPWPFSNPSAEEWHRLVLLLGQFTSEFQPQRLKRISGLHNLDVAITIIQNTANLLDEWPGQFNRLLTSIQTSDSVTQSLRRSFGCLYSVLYGRLKERSFQFLRDAFESYINENWWGLVCRRNRSFHQDTIKNHPRLTFQDAAQRVGTDPAVVRHLVQAELLPATERELPSGRQARSIHQNDIDQISALVKGAMTLTDAAKLLALPERRVRELVAAGILAPIVSRNATNSGFWLFPVEELSKLSSLSGLSRSLAKMVPFSQILKKWRLRKGEFVALVQAIIDGQLSIALTTPSPIGKVILAADLVRAWLGQYRLLVGGPLSVDQAAKLLGIKQQVAYGLVAKGILEATLSASMARTISMGQIRAFKETYVSLAELARHQKRSPKWLLKRINAMPVCGPSVDGVRQYFYKRKDIAAYGDEAYKY